MEAGVVRARGHLDGQCRVDPGEHGGQRRHITGELEFVMGAAQHFAPQLGRRALRDETGRR